jgi:PAS domain S-box-containing protein
LRKDGSVIYADINSTPVTLGGRPCLVEVFRNITERRQADAALWKRERQFAESQRIAHIGSWEHNLTTGEVVWSDELFRLLGLDPRTNQADFKMFFDMIHPEDRPVLKWSIDETVKTGGHFSIDCRLILRDGRTRTLHAEAELKRDETGTQLILSGTGQDITERKQAEEKISEKNTMLQTLIHAIPDQVFFKDSQGRFLLVNKAMEETCGIGQEELAGMTDDELLPPDVADRCKRSDAEAIKRGRPVYSDERYTDKKGETRFLDVVKAPIYDNKGDLKGLAVISRDITERKLAEEKMRQNEEFIRSILDTVDEGFIVIDRDYRILTANRAYCGQAARPCEEIIGRHCFEISHNSSRPCYEEGEECAVRQVFATGKPHAALHKHIDHEGHVLYVETKGFPLKNAEGKVISVIETVNNITEKHLLEEERLKTQKLESIGVLAGGIAHDFNNLLQGIFGYISMAMMCYDQKEKSLAMLEQAEKALHLSVNLTTQLLTFSKGGNPVKKTIDLAPVVENAVKFALSGSRTGYRLEIDPALWQVNGDAGQLGQVIQNIVLNADQAMPLGGAVAITARNIAADDALLPPGLAPGSYVALTIEDNGVGIPEACLNKIFDPYFTTKKKGSGLGLATSYSIIRNHQGQILVTSTVGKGTRFALYFPALTARPAAETAGLTAHAAVPNSRILVMDDEDLIRGLATELLGALGHDVEIAANGEAVLAAYTEAAAAGKPFDIVILDLTIRGGMGGAETLNRLREIDPQVRAVVSSGYSDDAAISEYRQQGFRAYLKKPYDVAELNKALHMVLA